LHSQKKWIEPPKRNMLPGKPNVADTTELKRSTTSDFSSSKRLPDSLRNTTKTEMLIELNLTTSQTGLKMSSEDFLELKLKLREREHLELRVVKVVVMAVAVEIRERSHNLNPSLHLNLSLHLILSPLLIPSPLPILSPLPIPSPLLTPNPLPILSPLLTPNPLPILSLLPTPNLDFPHLLTGETVVPFTQLKTKVDVDHAGPSLQQLPWKVTGT